MPRTLFTTTALLVLTSVFPKAVPANDIVDFLRAISGPPQYQRYSEPRHDHHPQAIQPVSQRHASHARFPQQTHGFTNQPHLANRNSRGRSFSGRSDQYLTTGIGQHGVHSGTPNPGLPAPPVPSNLGYLPHEIGQIVTCSVPLETCVRVRDERRIAPCAVPVTVAIRNPHLGRFGSCQEQLVYVQVFVPPCPVQRLKVSPCRTKIRMDYGKYAVNIVSRKGMVVIDYDN